MDPSPIKFRFPPGLSLLEDFVTPKEELRLMNLVDWGAMPSTVAQGEVRFSEGWRKVVFYMLGNFFLYS